MAPSRRVVLAVGAVLIVAGGLTAWMAAGRLKPVPKPSQEAAEQQELAGGPPWDPLMIEALRNREYPGGQAVVTQDVGRYDGYSTRVISYPSDGLKLYSLLAVPAAPVPAGGYPVIILCHGYIPPDQYRTTGLDYESLIGYFAQHGFAVLKPDYRGHDQSEGEPRGGHFSADYTVDILNLAASIGTIPGLNADRTGLIGHSLGGHVALRAIVVSGDIKASVMMAGVVGTADDLIYGWRRWRDERGMTTRRSIPSGAASTRQQLIERYGEPGEDGEYWHKIMAINYMENVAGPVQIHHGTNDESVPPFMSEHLAQALAKANKPHEYYVYPGGDHNFTGAARALFTERMRGFFEKYL